MDELIERIFCDGEIYALILRDGFAKPGVNFLTPPTFSQQLAFMRHPVGKIIEPHVHNPVPRAVEYTQETLIIKRGCLRVDFFDEKQNYLESRKLLAGDVILLVKGGHGFEVLVDVDMIEIKQGPYVGENDKTRFSGKVPTQR